MKYLLYLLIIFVIWLEVSDARGGRGGGSRGGSRSSSSRYRSSSTRSSSSSVRYYRGPTYSKGSWKTAAAVGTVYGLMSYRTRRMYYSYPNREPEVCYNEKNLKNGTYGYFICPEPYIDDDYRYCCGAKDEQKCCTKAQKDAETSGGKIAGIVIGVLAAFIIIGVTVYCCCIKNRRAKKQGVVLTKRTDGQPSGGGKPAHEMKPLTMGYSSDPSVPMSNFSSPPPPGPPVGAYDTNAGGLPYSTNPAEAPGYAPAMGTQAPYPQGAPAPYTDGAPAPFVGGFTVPPPEGSQAAPIGFDTKGPLPQGDVSGGLPYSSQPYPPAQPGPYPPANGPQGTPSAPPPPYSAN